MSHVLEIAKIYHNGQSAHESAFNAYVETRLANMTPEHQAVLRKYVPSITYVEDAPLYGGFFSENFEANARRIILPIELKNTVLPYVIAAHEMEHTIQSLEAEVRKEYKQALKTIGLIFFTANHNYTSEKRAMEAEWDFGSKLPKEELQRTVKAIQKSTLPKSVKKHYFRMFKGFSELDRENYIRAEHSAGRYSISSLRTSAFYRWVCVFTPGSAGIYEFINWLIK